MQVTSGSHETVIEHGFTRDERSNPTDPIHTVAMALIVLHGTPSPR
jgi:hypothetical protein